MTDKVQKIKEWISKEQNGLMDTQGNFEYPEHEGVYHILCNLDAYIDSLQEEPVSESLNTESMIESYKQRLISQANGVKNSPLINMCLASYKHGINETLDTLNLSNVKRTVKDRKEEPASEDLEKEIDSYFSKWLQGASDEGCFNPDSQLVSIYDCHRIARNFAAWQKQQMMAKAVDATVHIDAGGYPYIPQIELYDYDKDIPLAKVDDKYKVVLIKEG